MHKTRTLIIICDNHRIAAKYSNILGSNRSVVTLPPEEAKLHMMKQNGIKEFDVLYIKSHPCEIKKEYIEFDNEIVRFNIKAMPDNCHCISIINDQLHIESTAKSLLKIAKPLKKSYSQKKRG